MKLEIRKSGAMETNNKTAELNRLLLKKINSQAKDIQELMDELEEVREALKSFGEKHLKDEVKIK